MQDQLQSTLAAAKGGVTLAELVPPMMGASEPRRYLLVVQNNAETRSTGGLPGSLIVIDAVDGKLSLGDQRAVDDFDVLTSPVLPLTEEERALYGDNLGENIRDMNLTPDFPRAASLIDALQKRSFGTDIDGIISVDPVALASVLRATGPVEVGDETFTAGNVVRKLLNEVYQRYETRERAGRLLRPGVARDLQHPGHPGREAHEGPAAARTGRVAASFPGVEQPPRRAAPRSPAARVSGELPRDTGDEPHVGLYLNDGTAAKIEYYLDYVTSIRSARCTPKGAQTLQVGMVLTRRSRGAATSSPVSSAAPAVRPVGHHAAQPADVRARPAGSSPG